MHEYGHRMYTYINAVTKQLHVALKMCACVIGSELESQKDVFMPCT